jgi:hypothetical protein
MSETKTKVKQISGVKRIMKADNGRYYIAVQQPPKPG